VGLILFAPNVHTGGGRVVLEALYEACGASVHQAILDNRLIGVSRAFESVATLRVRNRILSRLHAEWHLWRSARMGDTVLCLHSLPPLLPLKARVVVLMQNSLLLDRGRLGAFPLTTRLRILIERLWGTCLQTRCSKYVVQTPSMAAALRAWLSNPIPIVVLPFAPGGIHEGNQPSDSAPKRFDFIYVASGEAHKNHLNLLHAWRLMADAGLTPSLAVTIDTQVYPELTREIDHHTREFGLNIVNLGVLPGVEVSRLYQAAKALVFPSTTESFGLPLIEAAQHGLPIVASELDFVRDVVTPVETFDAASPISIARAIRRFMGQPEQPVAICPGATLLDEVLN
jgi:glycosyltransferase involved in cell wall biosynthesis